MKKGQDVIYIYADHFFTDVNENADKVHTIWKLESVPTSSNNESWWVGNNKKNWGEGKKQSNISIKMNMGQ